MKRNGHLNGTASLRSCPRCGGTNTTVRFLATLNGYACRSCGHTWNVTLPPKKPLK